LEFCHLLLQSRIHDVLVLAGHLVINQVNAGLASLLDQGRLRLLTIRIVGLLTHATAKVHVAELLRSEVEELLLKLLLALGEVDLGREKLGGDVGVDFTILELELRRRKNLVIHRMLLLLLVVLGSASETSPDSSLWHALGSVEALATTHVVLTLTVRGGGRRLGRRRRLRGSAQTSKEMRAAGARRRNFRVLGDGSDLGGRGNAQALERSTLAARTEATSGHTEATGLEVVEGHLSKTASVHAHFVLVGVRKAGTKSKAEQSGTWDHLER
jgi:hypothetical protein